MAHDPFRNDIVVFLARELGESPDVVDTWLETPPDPALGEYALPCFPLAKAQRKPPTQIAQGLAERFRPTALVREARSASAYVNFTVDRTWMPPFSVFRTTRSGRFWLSRMLAS